MTARSKHRGHPIEWHGHKWGYSDPPAPGHLKYGKKEGQGERPCTHCHAHSEPGGPDRCLGRLAGVKAACCGHGCSEDAYIFFNSGLYLEGLDAAQLINIWVCNLMTPDQVVQVYLLTADLELTSKACKVSRVGFSGDRTAAELMDISNLLSESV